MGRNYHKEFKNRKLKKPNLFIANIVQIVFKRIAKKGTYFTFKIRMATDTVKFIVDEDFYNEFVKAINEVV